MVDDGPFSIFDFGFSIGGSERAGVEDSPSLRFGAAGEEEEDSYGDEEG